MSLWGSLVHDEWETLLIGGTYYLPEGPEVEQDNRKEKTRERAWGRKFYRKPLEQS